MEETTLPQHDYAGFWARFASYFIDGAIVAFLVLQLYYLSNASLTTYLNAHPNVVKDLTRFMGKGDEYSSGWSDTYRVSESLLYYILTPYSFLVPWVYFAGFESSPLRATPGKYFLGMYVTDMEGNRIGFGKASGRHFAKILSGFILCWGYVMAGYTEYRQALHDKIAGCLVWRK
ncbi:MAG: RDD family protein [Chitinophagales bacterium]